VHSKTGPCGRRFYACGPCRSKIFMDTLAPRHFGTYIWCRSVPDTSAPVPKCLQTLRHRYRNVSRHFGKVQQANSAFSSCRPASLEQTACSPSTTQNCRPTFHGGVLCLLINNSNCVFNAATTAYCILLYCILSYRILL